MKIGGYFDWQIAFIDKEIKHQDDNIKQLIEALKPQSKLKE
jgi:hypothetical protein